MARLSRLAALGGVALGGVFLAHCLAYLIADPRAGTRHAHMSATGHDWFPALAALASALAAAALVAACIQALTSAATWRAGRTGAVLAAIQIPAFLALELLERGFALDAALPDPAVRVGLALQIVVGAAAALLLRALERKVRSVAAGVRRRTRVANERQRPAAAPLVARVALLRTTRRRAPPLPFAA